MRSLGEFDITTLRKLRTLAEGHVRAATEAALTAAADPTDYVTEDMLNEFVDLSASSWEEGIGLVMATFGELPTPMYQSVVEAAISKATSFYQDLLLTLTQDNAWGRKTPIYGEFMVGNAVQYGDVRPILSILGGGSPDSTVQLLGGITTGHTMSEWLGWNGIQSDQKIWLYGEGDRRTFNGHLQMDGLVFTDWNDDGLRISPQDAWLRRAYYEPGDHFGCACIVAPYIPNFGDPIQAELP